MTTRNLTIDLLGLANRFLPVPGGIGTDVRTGRQSESKASPCWVTALKRAARDNNQVA